MKKTIVEKTNGIIQVTSFDERWYVDTRSKAPKFVPSVTWIAGKYPKGIQFYKWLAEHGWDESEAIKTAAGDKGSKVHAAIVDLLDGKEVRMEDKYFSQLSGKEEELTFEEYESLVGFQNWAKEFKPKVIEREITVFNDDFGYAGTIDLVAEVEGKRRIIDFKTGQSVWPEYELQLSAYKQAYPGVRSVEIHGEREIEIVKPIEELQIVQVGYRRNKQGYKVTNIEDKFPLFVAAKQIWENECGDESPSKRNYPEIIKL